MATGTHARHCELYHSILASVSMFTTLPGNLMNEPHYQEITIVMPDLVQTPGWHNILSPELLSNPPASAP